ncbi:MAG: DEAD/DEAH box helicase, partial [Armatimonadetes bacterium]|nr:DEAD/DEAH box helicase [Armatimonadota bacterium]
MLSRFLAAQQTELHKIPVGPFFGFKRDGDAMDPGTSLSEGFIIWIGTDSLRSDPALIKELERLLVGTALDGVYISALDETREAIHLAREEFARECEAIRFDLTDTKDNAPRTFALQRQIKRLTGEYLLGDLAGRGFLPGYGFPTDVVNFDNHVFVKGEQLAPKPGDVSPTSDSANRRFHLRDTPSRQLDLAIRDYSPGTDVVVDGRVYRSAGLTLDWKRPVTEENSRNIQSLGVAWRCKNCGATGTTHVDPKVCSSCGLENLITHRYLKPAGFSCDPWEKPHDKIEEVSFIKPRTAWVAAQG